MAIKMRTKKGKVRRFKVGEDVFLLQSYMDADGKTAMSTISLDPETEFEARVGADGSTVLVIGSVRIDGWTEDDLKALLKGGKVEEVS